MKQNFQALSEECGKLSCLNAELKGRLAEVDQTRMMVFDPVNTKETEDRIQELQGQVDIVIKEKAAFEAKL